jgi:hypothetical protein
MYVPKPNGVGETIGFSVQGRPLEVKFFGESNRPLRLFFLCGQHGDERAIRKAIRHFMQHHATELASSMPFVQWAILSDANPDGYAARQRVNATGIDLNRDHIRLAAPETRAIHAFVQQWQPHLIVDLHNYPARRRHLVNQRLRLGWDLCLDIPTNPAAGCSPGSPVWATLFDALQRVSQQNGFHFGRYGLYDASGSFRHGTPQLGDARNSLTLRYETPTILLEARNPSRSDVPHDRHVLRSAVAQCCREISAWALQQANALQNFCLPLTPGEMVPLSFRRKRSSGGVVPVYGLDDRSRSELPCTSYRASVEARRHRAAPPNYRVDVDHPIHRLGYQSLATERGVILPLPQRGGRLLSLLLEPASRFRLESPSTVERIPV